MTSKECLRCDWQGVTDAKRCPTCAEPLYAPRSRPPEGAEAPVRGHSEERSREAASTASVAPSGVPPRPSSPHPGPVGPTEPAEPTNRSRSLIAFVVVALVLATAIGSWLDAHKAPPRRSAAPASPMRLGGTLVYAVPDGAGHTRLWRWDLASGVVQRGPRVTRAIGLVDASGAKAGWVGLTSELADGRLRASLLPSLGSGDRAVPLITGDLVSWGPRGDTVVAARRGVLEPGCRRRVSIVLQDVVPRLRERQYADPALCGDLLSVAQGNASTFFTLQRGSRTGIFLAGFHRIHPVLAGHALVGMSAVNDMLVVPARTLHGVPVAARPEQRFPDLSGTGLFFQGQRPTVVTSYGVAGEGFAIERVLTWSPDALTALVIGRLGDRRGVYELDAGPAVGQRTPRYVARADGYLYATWTAYGVAILETRNGLFILTPHASVRMAAPTDAPAPLGPIVWIH